MSALAFYKRLRDAGVDEATAMLCAQEFDQELKIAVDAILEPRRAKDRARKSRKSTDSEESMESVDSADSAEIVESAETLSLPPSPQTPQPPTHTRVSDNSRERVREDAGFVRFWDAYPRKVSKAEARKAFTRAWKKLPPHDEEAVLIGGLERAKASWVDSQFIPHAATWLNGERWNDESLPATVTPMRPHGSAQRPQRQTAYVERLGDIDAAMAAAFERDRGFG